MYRYTHTYINTHIYMKALDRKFRWLKEKTKSFLFKEKKFRIFS